VKKVLIFGSNGLLGQSLVKKFAGEYEITGAAAEDTNYISSVEMDYHKIDIANRAQSQQLLNNISPDLIINAAAYTNVDKSEIERELCWNVNVRGVENIVESGLGGKSTFVHISTDYVFDGSVPPYRETDRPNPKGNYARSKMASENIVKSSDFEYMIIRTQVLYGTGNNVRLNFVTWVIDQLTKGETIKIAFDQVGKPTYAPDVSEAIYRLLNEKCFGLYHVSGKESINRYDLALKIAKVFDLDKNLIESISTKELKQLAPRPMNSSFILDKLYNNIGWLPHDVDSGLQLLKEELKEHNG